MSNITGWSRGLEVSGGGQGVVSHAGLALLRHLADKTGLAGGLSRALASPRMLVHDRGRVLADVACAVADGARVISDFRVMSDQRELFGLVASVPTAWRTLNEIAGGGTRADKRITAAVNMGRARSPHRPPDRPLSRRSPPGPLPLRSALPRRRRVAVRARRSYFLYGSRY